MMGLYKTFKSFNQMCQVTGEEGRKVHFRLGCSSFVALRPLGQAQSCLLPLFCSRSSMALMWSPHGSPCFLPNHPPSQINSMKSPVREICLQDKV